MQRHSTRGTHRRGGMRIVRAWLLAAGAAAVTAAGAAAQQAGAGRITGRVVDVQTGEGLSGVMVSVEGTEHGTLSDVNGRYMITKVPAGTHIVIAQNLGFGTKRVTEVAVGADEDRKSTRLNSSHVKISYAVFCLKKKTHVILFCAVVA